MAITIKEIIEDVKEIFIILSIFTIILSFLDKTHFNGLENTDDNNIIQKLTDRLYLVTTTLSSVGYGDISPKSNIAKYVIILIQLCVILTIKNWFGIFPKHN